MSLKLNRIIVSEVRGVTLTSGKLIATHCDPEPDSEKLKCLHHFYMDNYDSNDKNHHYY